jgi:hypothetical protein
MTSVKSNVVSMVPDSLSSANFDTIEERLIAIKKSRSVKEVQRHYLRNKKYLDSLILRSKSLTDTDRIELYKHWYKDLAILRDECKMMLVSLEDFLDSDRKSAVIRIISNMRNSLPALAESLRRKVSAISYRYASTEILERFGIFAAAAADFTGKKSDIIYQCHVKDGEATSFSAEILCDVKSVNGYFPSDYYLHISQDSLTLSCKLYTEYHSDNPYLKSQLVNPEHRLSFLDCTEESAATLLPILFLNNGFVSHHLYDRIEEHQPLTFSDLRISIASNSLFAVISSKVTTDKVKVILEVFCYFLFGSYDLKRYLKQSQRSKTNWLFEFALESSFSAFALQTLPHRLMYMKDLFSISNNAYPKFLTLGTNDV